ncbi:cytochrome b/b6 domain-containing protein [Pseudomonadales bacterium]|nr:cytochrome b/b6 domain-containing protein [Pseudomonadales bacterium]
MSELKPYVVWDAGTRWFHWLNVLCVIGLMAVGLVVLFGRDLGISSDGKVLLKTVHTLIGYVFVLNLIWRFIWGFLGNQHARWQSIKIKRGFFGTVRRYIASIRAGRPEQYLGHNPLGRLSVVLLFALLATQMVTGLVLAGTDLFFPPIGHWIAQWVAAPGIDPGLLVANAPQMYDSAAYESMREYRKIFGTIHVYGFYTLAVMIVMHVVAVVVTEIRSDSNIISAMFTGRKILSERPQDEQH